MSAFTGLKITVICILNIININERHAYGWNVSHSKRAARLALLPPRCLLLSPNRRETRRSRRRRLPALVPSQQQTLTPALSTSKTAEFKSIRKYCIKCSTLSPLEMFENTNANNLRCTCVVNWMYPRFYHFNWLLFTHEFIPYFWTGRNRKLMGE